MCHVGSHSLTLNVLMVLLLLMLGVNRAALLSRPMMPPTYLLASLGIADIIIELIILMDGCTAGGSRMGNPSTATIITCHDDV